MNTLKERNKLVEAEIKRLKLIFKDMPEDKMKVVEGLITQASRLRVLLNDMWIDISEKGDYESFTQSKELDPYERKRPIADLYNVRDNAYHKVIKQLIDYLPENTGDIKDKVNSSGGDLI